MSEFTSDELTLIAEAAFDDPTAGMARLTETFGPTNVIRLMQAAAIADRIRAGESIQLGDGVFFARDAGEVGPGRTRR